MNVARDVPKNRDKACSVRRCTKPVYAKMLCRNHYNQQLHGVNVHKVAEKWDRAIEYYYRSKTAGNRRMTLACAAEKFGYSASYLRKVKRYYDADGKWGSKRAKS